MILCARSIRERVTVRRGSLAALDGATAAAGRMFGPHPELSPASLEVHLDQDLWLFPGICRLGSAQEYLDMPTDIMGRVHDKSSLARKGVSVKNTIIQPGWRGHLTLEITLSLRWPMRLRKGTQVAQIVFETLDQPAEPYAGQYQDQPARPVKAGKIGGAV